MLTLMDADSLDCAYQILGLDIPEQKKNSLKLLLKYILRQFNSEDIEGGDDGGSHWYVKVFPKVMDLLVSNKNRNLLKTACLTVTSFPRISFGKIRQLIW